MYFYSQINLHSIINTNYTSYKQAHNLAKEGVCWRSSVLRFFMFNSKTVLCVRFGVSKGSVNENCRFEACTCWVPKNVLRSFLIFINSVLRNLF
jgi:hypothetical protein